MLQRVLAPAALALLLASCGGGGVNEAAPAAPLANERVPQAQQAADPTTGALRVYQAFYGRAPTAAEFRAFTSPDAMTLATGFAAGFSAMSDATLARAVLSNLGVTSASVNAQSYAILETALTQYFAAFGGGARGVIVNNLVGLLAGLEADATWGAPARAFNATVTAARAVVAASTSAGGACTPSVAQGFRGDIEATAASAGDSGGDGSGSGGSGGGAAAGGGLGKVLGGTMRVTDLATGNVVGEGTTDATTGLVTIRTCSLAGPFLLTLEGKAGARYYDEGRNALLDFPAGRALHALVTTWDEHVGVSPLTEAAYRYALNNFKADAASVAGGQTPLASTGSLVGLTAAQARAANAAILSEVNALNTTSLALSSINTLPTPLDTSSGSTSLGTSKYARSARVNGGLVAQAATFNGSLAAPALSLVDDVAADLTDGKINGLSLDGRATAGAAYELARLPVYATAGAATLSNRFGAGDVPLTIVDEVWTMNECATDRTAVLSNGEVRTWRDRPIMTVTPPRLDCSAIRPRGLIRNVLTDVVNVFDTIGYTYAIKSDGSMYAWGELLYPLGSAAAGFHADTPQLVGTLRGVTSISGINYVYARTSSGEVYELPSGNFGQRVVWHPTQNTAITRMPELRNIALVRQANGNTSNFFAIDYDGNVWGWGDGCGGALANGTALSATGIECRTMNLQLPTPDIVAAAVPRPQRIASLTNVVDIASMDGTMMALHKDGTVSVWGTDSFRILGRGAAQAPQLAPTKVQDISGIRQISGMPSLSALDCPAAGSCGSYTGFLLLRDDGRVVFWGNEGGRFAMRVLDAPVNVRSLSRGTNGGFAQLRDGSYVDPLNAPATDRGALYR